MELNKVYNMDNLELLKQLPSNSIDLIYCDILYNTGKKFKDYDDNLGTAEDITLSASPTAFTEISFALTTPAPLGALETPASLFFFLISPND